MMDLMEKIREHVKAGDYRFTFHGFERCTERKISPNEIEDVIFSGEIIENYPRDKYGPSCLVFGITKTGSVLHVQCSIDPVWIITVTPSPLSRQKSGVYLVHSLTSLP